MASPNDSTAAFVHLSDPHMTSLRRLRARDLVNKRLLGYLSWRRSRRRDHDPEVLGALRHALADHPGDAVVITGDLTHLGTPDEYAEARDWLATLGPAERVSVVPGNHDLYAPVTPAATLAHWDRHMGGDGATAFPFERRHGPISFIGVNTAYPSAPLLATGRIGTAQMARLSELLERTGAEGRFRVVFMHHPPQHDAVGRRKALNDAMAFREVIRRQGAELILHGHTHRLCRARLDGPAAGVPVLGASSASTRSARFRRNAAYYRCRVTDDGGRWRLSVSMHAYCPDKAVFAEHSSSDGPLSDLACAS
ncbi:metallophosphoesterase family protein [Arhodomonas aquaeolei]|uniref:metallophosphoesterase family protein n=1 Tax=Arhodomonas aquaeolei TaxID=2369 RepID=UPI000370E994|nr:metallophosphoesterase [Arhodomonas aquaeolei]